MAITSASTIAQINAEYKDTLYFRSPVNVALAHRHLAAIYAMMVDRPTSATKGANSFGFSANNLQTQADKVLKWLERHDDENNLSGPDVINVDFRHNPRYSS